MKTGLNVVNICPKCSGKLSTIKTKDDEIKYACVTCQKFYKKIPPVKTRFEELQN